ncbi:adhesion G protein-coupled receptor E1-like [Macrobrachium nipponense]|uniref:adhesion G protein-coupled receptor E1-like n=1 Tax=Macrobrachium nipponense TaxID=159736 RepID=UPI0030C7DAD3
MVYIFFVSPNTNECDSNPCGPNSQCQNTHGSLSVSATLDLNECESTPCGPNGVCSNSPGSFSCNCSTGYAFSGGSCVDIDECLSNPCPNVSVCTNTPGSYLCQCPPGYNLTSGACVDIDDCASATCPQHKFCSDKLLGYDCTYYTCAERCQYGAIFIEEFGSCFKLIIGEMTFEDAMPRCKQDFVTIHNVKSDEDFPILASYFLAGISDMAWVGRAAAYNDSITGTCLGMTSTSNPPRAKSLQCDSKLRYAVCVAKKYY